MLAGQASPTEAAVNPVTEPHQLNQMESDVTSGFNNLEQFTERPANRPTNKVTKKAKATPVSKKAAEETPCEQVSMIEYYSGVS